MRIEDEFFRNSNPSDLWQRYCGFLQLPLTEFNKIQRDLLKEQIDLISKAPFYQKLIHCDKVTTIEDFRKSVPLRKYHDYELLFKGHNDNLLDEPLSCWVETSGIQGTFKRAPWVQRFLDVQRRDIISALILSSAREFGDIKLAPGSRIMQLLPGKPFATAWMASDLVKNFSVRSVPSLKECKSIPFSKRIDSAIMSGLTNDVEYVIAMTSSLKRMGERFNQIWGEISRKPKTWISMNPRVSWRVARKLGQGNAIPKKVWSVKGVINWGSDSDYYSKTIEEQWGTKPLQVYGSSEGGIMAMQDWNKTSLSLLPDSVFFEFIPQEKINDLNPPTLLINELEIGKVYELVLTSFYGMPFIRYRQGDLLKIINSAEGEDSVPRVMFAGKADDTIDLFGIARLDTEVISKALNQIGLSYSDWCINKEYVSGAVILRVYTELNGNHDVEDVGRKLSRSLILFDRHWAEAVYTMSSNPIKITPVPKGTFQSFKNRNHNSSLVQINPPRSMIDELTGNN